MIITCQACNTSFNLDDKMLKPSGSKVRCSVCANVFTAFPEQRPSEAPAADAVEADTAPPLTSSADLAAAAAAIDAAPDADKDAEPESEEGFQEAMDDDGLDVAVDAETDLEPKADDATAGDEGATMIASLDDDDLDLDLSTEGVEEDASATVIADLDEDDFDLSIDEPSDVGETVIVDLDQEDFDLEVPPGADEALDDATVVVTDLDDDALDVADADLDLSFDLEGDEDAASPPAEASLDDLSLDFDLEPDADAALEEPETAVGGEVDDEMDLALDFEDEGTADGSSDAMVLEDDLDLSSLEGLLDDEAPDEDDSVTMVVDDDEGSELNLALDAAPPETADEAGRLEESLADLEFELEEEGKADAGDVDAAEGGEEEVDLSEIEKMLETPEAGDEKFTAVPEQDLDLDIEASLETEKWMSESGDVVADEELDLSELEHVLEDVDTESADDASEDQELELDLADAESPADAGETVALDNELEFDLTDFEEDGQAAAVKGDVSREPADMDLDFEVEEESPLKQAQADDSLEETVAIPDTQAEPAKEQSAAPAAAAAPVSAPKPPKKGVSKSLVFLLILIILGGAGYGTYYLLNQSGIEIPFLSDYLKPKVQDPGNLKLTTYDINSKFVDNANVGKLFVITGKVKNGYPENRGMISLVGKIFSTGKVPVHEELIYCGNVMSDLELANLEWDKIEARLANRLGDNRSNVKIEPGKSIPFMVVFSGLPDDLEEFTIEPVGSTSLK